MANRGLGITLPLALGSNGYFASTTDTMTQVRTNLMNLVLTQRGERLMQPDFGCDLPLSLFENPSADRVAEMQAAIQTAANIWMPFIRIDNVQVVDTSDTTSSLSIKFTLLTTNTTDSITLRF